MADKSVIDAWMREVMLEKDWSAERWASLAETSATNITRFLSGKSPHIPSTKTLAKLAAVAGSSPEIGRASVKSPALLQVSLYNWSEIGDIIANENYKKQTEGVVATMVSVSDKAYAVEVEVETLAQHGIMKGDTVIVEPKPIRTPKTGDYVVFLDNGGVPSIGQFFDSIIVGGRERYAPSEVAIGGVIVEVRRSL